MPMTTSDSPSLPDRDTGSKVFRTDEPATAEPEYLSECSPKDRPWDEHRSQADDIAAIYANAHGSVWFSRLGERVGLCSWFLGFAWSPEKADSDVLTLKLREAHFCRVRHCPVCQWRRSLMWTARFLGAVPEVLLQYPKARFLFLTVTQRNVPVNELRATLGAMSKAWDRMRKRREFAVVLGWLRTVEVTRAQDGSAHPHYHVLLMVPGDYFRTPEKYIPQSAWTRIWRESLNLSYDPIVYVTAVKPKRGRPAKGQEPLSGLLNAACETLKYSVKPSDMTADPSWFLELTTQLHKLQFIASGGVLKDVLRQEQETDEDLMLLGEGKTTEHTQLYFEWWRQVRRYKRQRGPIQ